MICFCVRIICFLICLAVVGLSVPPIAIAQLVFVENFDNPAPPNGRILYDAGSLYNALVAPLSGGDSDGNQYENGRIVQSYDTLINADQSGSGFFLHHRTGGGGGPFTQEVWGTVTPVVVTPATPYELSYYLTNENTISNASIRTFINGAPVGSPVSAVGRYLSHSWQQFTFSWNSGHATTADLSLVNLVAGGGGNDFAIDTITFRRVPEPTTLLMTATGIMCNVILIRQRMRRPA